MVAAVDSGQPILIELVGPAGSGKTTLSRALVARGAHAGVALPRSLYLLAVMAGAMRLAPAFLARLGTGRPLGVAELRAVAYLSAWRRRVGSQSGVTLFDQGPIYRLAYLREFGPGLIRSRAFMRWWSAELERWARTLDVVVLLDAPDDVLLERVNLREGAHLIKGADGVSAREFLARYRAAFDEVVGAMARLDGPDIIVLDSAETDPACMVETVSARLATRAG